MFILYATYLSNDECQKARISSAQNKQCAAVGIGTVGLLAHCCTAVQDWRVMLLELAFSLASVYQHQCYRKVRSCYF